VRSFEVEAAEDLLAGKTDSGLVAVGTGGATTLSSAATLSQATLSQATLSPRTLSSSVTATEYLPVLLGSRPMLIMPTVCSDVSVLETLMMRTSSGSSSNAISGVMLPSGLVMKCRGRGTDDMVADEAVVRCRDGQEWLSVEGVFSRLTFLRSDDEEE